MAWLHATPKEAKQSRITQLRLADLQHPLISLPEVGGAICYVEWLQEVGTYLSNGMSIVPVTWQEIDAWVRCTEISEAIPWCGKKLIKELSEAYVSEYHAANDPQRPAPYKEDSASAKKQATKQLTAMFDSMMGGKKGK